ncbi:MAG: universal stress protein, partial [Candidatus Puniceispirillaceae bacterium]
MIRKILVPVRGDGKGDNVLAHAAALARGFNAHIKITHCRAKPENLLPFGVPIPAALRAQLAESTSQVFDIEEAGLRDEVLALSKTLNIRLSDAADGKSVTASFVEEAGRQIDVIGHHGRLADIIAVAQPDIDRNLGANTLKAALFNTGRPVLMCPEAKKPIPEILGKNITIAWDGSREASRAVTSCLQLLVAAKSVSVLTVKSKPVSVKPDELQDYLSAHGIAADVVEIETKLKTAQALLVKSAALGADLMV